LGPFWTQHPSTTINLLFLFVPFWKGEMEKCHTSEKQNSVLSFLIDMYKKQNKKIEPGMVSMYHYNIWTIVFGKNYKKTKAVSIYGLQQQRVCFGKEKNLTRNSFYVWHRIFQVLLSERKNLLSFFPM